MYRFVKLFNDTHQVENILYVILDVLYQVKEFQKKRQRNDVHSMKEETQEVSYIMVLQISTGNQFGMYLSQNIFMMFTFKVHVKNLGTLCKNPLPFL